MIMEGFINYINSVLPDRDGDAILYKFKRKTLDEMTARAAEITARGLNNPKVTDDLIISEYANLAEDYDAYRTKKLAEKRAKRNVILNAVGSVVYILALVVAFLSVSFATHNWHMTWGIIPVGVLIWVVYLLMLGVKKITSMKRIFHIFARMMLASAIIIGTVAAYILVLSVTDGIEHRWLIVIAGLIAMFTCDGCYAVIAKHRLAIINWLIYIPVISVFMFIFIGALGVMSWGTAWIVIPLALMLDVVIIIIAIGRNKIEKTEVADAWNEN